MKQLIGKIILLALLTVLPLVAYNVIFDPYSVLRKNYNSLFICPHERFVKTDYILSNPTKYDSFLFGSSRVSQVPMRVLNAATGGNFYNMTFVSGVVSEYLKTLKIFLKNNVTVKHVVIGLDYFSFRMLPLSNMVRNEGYPETLQDKIKFYITFLFLEPDPGMLKEIRFDGKDAAYDLTGTGEYDFLKKEEFLRLHPELHDAKFNIPIATVCNARIDVTLAELREIIGICRRNGITLAIFINPEHLNMYLCEDVAFLSEVRRRLADLSDFWDFSGPNSVTVKNINYIDIIHYRKHVGAWVIGRMYRNANGVPDDFGTLVSKRNAAGYCTTAEREYRIYRKRNNPTCLPCQKF
ncbi:MAG: hypothetical protein A2176_08675 [Spirochaetes bacterium RBG_13_51_14]|nr:MAG: hypothetical protein A2176_08675 [Spirochaetes bacterium RBG_13_51_14]